MDVAKDGLICLSIGAAQDQYAIDIPMQSEMAIIDTNQPVHAQRKRVHAVACLVAELSLAADHRNDLDRRRVQASQLVNGKLTIKQSLLARIGWPCRDSFRLRDGPFPLPLCCTSPHLG